MDDLTSSKPNKPSPSVLINQLFLGAGGVMVMAFFAYNALVHHDKIALGMAPLVPLLFGWPIWQQRRLLRFNRENSDAIVLLNKGAVAQASSAFQSLADRYRRPRNLHLTAVLNCGAAELRQGHYARAIELLAPIAQQKRVSNLQILATAELACATALAGQLDDAKAWLARATALPNTPSSLVWPRALVAARSGEHVELARKLDASWPELSSTMSAEVLDRLLLLKAFGIAATDGPRGAGALTPLIARLAPRKGTFGWMTQSWPELAAFLAAHDLAN